MPGLVLTPTGADAAWFAPSAETVQVCIFDRDGMETRHGLRKDSEGMHRGEIAGVRHGDRYGLRVHGPWQPEAGIWHDEGLLLVDPYARAVSGGFVDHPSLHHDGPRGDTAPWVPRAVAIESPPPPRPGPRVPWDETVIYETHVRGLTMRHPHIPPGQRGTYTAAASDPVVEHLQRMGITTVELLPVAHHVTEPFLQSAGRSNYWGYSTLAWFAPHSGYAAGDDGRQVTEFAAMVDAFHAAGIEVILDMVFNHTAEGGLSGPILSMKGLGNAGWYRVDANGRYIDWTGTGNTVDTADPRVRTAILEALRWWSQNLGVDGFRFDLAVTLGRDGEQFSPENLGWITSDPALASTKLIAEPWDLGPGGYRLGGFGPGWAEWNDRFRDDIRDVWRGRGDGPDLALRIGGSRDVFGSRRATSSVNFVTAHDGFTLRDLVSYDDKHNEANGEDNLDGHDDNRSWNSGAEGPTDDAHVLEVRRRRSASLLTTLLLSVGVPMLLGGDELGHTQEGNNNAYSLDGPLTWYDWSAAPFVELISRLVELRGRYRPTGAGVHAVDGSTAIELGTGADRLVVAANPSAESVDLPLPDGTWLLELDSTDAAASGAWSGTVPVPAWTVRVLAASPAG